MFDNVHSSAMRNGSRLLFAIALLLFVAGLLQGIRLLGATNMEPFGHDNEFRWGWLELVGTVLNALSYSVAPLIGALAVDRADRWLARAGHTSI
jgi:hypothetical protein